uniref:glutamate-cysteine ligase family protein n=1 Tax=Lentzea alba TaxID=2714351 RepID=UPI0039BF960A
MNDYTVGVEQEFLLVDPESRRPVALAPRVREISRAPGDLDVQGELTPFQIEIATGITHSFEELDEQVRRARRVLVEAADAAGCRLVATGMPPIGKAGPPPGTDDPRYHQIEYSHRRLGSGRVRADCTSTLVSRRRPKLCTRPTSCGRGCRRCSR